MNPKSVYTILALIALCSMLNLPESALKIMGGLLCIGAVYYIVERLRKRRRLSVMIMGMCLVVIVFNPIYMIYPSDNVLFWMLSRIIATALFWMAARKAPLSDE
ncbi:hypothetical protein [Porphyromonas sp.]|uniref:hypothetical protein n=1 Tax=Porphyromonas sp. TaxID=1924944 RepID=UPI0026DC5133|nr:hypothetical protein [Porphyromonas sp.]MDO4771878.1 hypothetical protein [Porphyromonas sp.]